MGLTLRHAIHQQYFIVITETSAPFTNMFRNYITTKGPRSTITKKSTFIKNMLLLYIDHIGKRRVFH